MLKLTRTQRVGVVAAALMLGGGAGITLVVAADAPPDGCVSNQQLFAFTTGSRKLRQTNVAVFHQGKVVNVTTDHLSQDPSFSPDGSRVVFSSGRDGEFHPEFGYTRLSLFTASSTGGDVKRLTSGVYDDEPDWSPDGSTVVFVRRRFSPRQNPQYDFPDVEELWTVDVRSGREQLLLRAPRKRGTPFAFHSPVWSLDGSQIAFSRAGSGGHGLWLMNADGSTVRRLITHTGIDYFDSPALAWSPSGEGLVLNGGTEHGRGIVVKDVDDGRPRLIADGGSDAAWSPDGSQIAYFEFQPPDNGYRLAVRNADGTGKDYPEGEPVYGDQLDWACTRPAGPSALPPPDEPGARCDGTFRVVHRSTRQGNLVGLDVTPAGIGWAVSDDPPRVVRFDRRSYEYVTGVPVSGDVFLNDVAAPASDRIFVVGGDPPKGGGLRWRAVLLRWDGHEWARMDAPAPRGTILQSVVAVAPDDVWAVGFFYPPNSGSRALTLHFDGTRWSRVDVPSSARNDALMAIGASSATNVWAVGNRGEDRVVVHRFDGSRWTEVDLPRGISQGSGYGVEVLSTDDVWVVDHERRTRHGYSQGVLHFDGRRWTSELIEDAASLTDVEAVGRGEVWAVGYTGSTGLEGTAKPLAVRRTGSWQSVAIEDPEVGGEFASVAVDDRGDVWAIGEKAGSDWVIQRACRRRDDG